MQHAFNGWEQHVEGVKVDGMTKDCTVLEFGCFLHGHEACYPWRATVNPVNGLTMQELREKTRIKTDMLRSKGHVVIKKWEWEFRKDVEADEELKAFFKEYEPYFPIKPCDAFFGGWTNAIVLHHQEADICYVDFTSLYPWVCKYRLFPLGHSSILD